MGSSIALRSHFASGTTVPVTSSAASVPSTRVNTFLHGRCVFLSVYIPRFRFTCFLPMLRPHLLGAPTSRLRVIPIQFPAFFNSFRKLYWTVYIRISCQNELASLFHARSEKDSWLRNVKSLGKTSIAWKSLCYSSCLQRTSSRSFVKIIFCLEIQLSFFNARSLK